MTSSNAAVADQRFDAFVSYSRRDIEFARKLTAALDRYKAPRELEVENRQLNVMRDEEDLTGPEYNAAIRRFLSASDHLLVLCSPNSRASKYVNDEIRRFAELKSADRVIPVLVSGIPNNEAGPGQESEMAFPDALLEIMEMPLAVSYIDFDPKNDKVDRGAWSNAWFTLLANLYGVSRSEIEQRELRRRIRRRNLTVSIVSAIAISLGLLSAFAWQQKLAADAERRVAEERLAQNYWQRGLEARSGGDLTEYAHWLAQAAALEAGEARRDSSLLGIGAWPGSVRLAAMTDGFGEALMREDVFGAEPRTRFSPDESLILTWLPGDNSARGNGVARLWRSADGAPVGEPMQHDYYIFDAEFLPDGRLLTWGGGGPVFVPGSDSLMTFKGQIKVWDSTTAELRYPALEADGVYEGVVLQPDQVTLLSWGGGTVQLWDLRDGTALRPPMEHDFKVDHAWVIDDARVLSRDYPGNCYLWALDEDPQDVECSAYVAEGDSDEQDVDLSESVAYGPVRSGSRTLEIDDHIVAVRSDESSGGADALLPHRGNVWSAIFDEAGRRVLTISGIGVARLWDVGPAQRDGVWLEHRADVHGVALDSDEQRILAWDGDPNDIALQIRLWRPNGDEITAPMEHGPTLHPFAHRGGEPAGAAVFDRDQSRILSWGIDASVRLWDASDGSLLHDPMMHDGRLIGARFSPDERQIVSFGRDRTVRRWDAGTGSAVGEPMRHDGEALGAVYDASGARILSWAEGEARVWDASTGEPLTPALKHDGGRVAAAFSPDEESVLTWGEDKHVRLWSLADGSPIIEMATVEPVADARFTEDGSRIFAQLAFSSAWGRTAGGAQLWNVADGSEAASPMVHDDLVHGARLFDQERRVLTWSDDATAAIWDSTTGEMIARMRHLEPVTGAMLTPVGDSILTWSSDDTARLWHAHDGTSASLPMDHGADVGGAHFSPDGRWLVTWSNDDRIHFWDPDDGSPIATPIEFGNSEEAELAGIRFADDGATLLAWGTGGVSIRSIAADFDFPAEHLPLLIEVATGTALDEQGNVRFLDAAEWGSRRDTLSPIVEHHAAECAYPDVSLARVISPTDGD